VIKIGRVVNEDMQSRKLVLEFMDKLSNGVLGGQIDLHQMDLGVALCLYLTKSPSASFHGTAGHDYGCSAPGKLQASCLADPRVCTCDDHNSVFQVILHIPSKTFWK
jgi:hypothetical protein